MNVGPGLTFSEAGGVTLRRQLQYLALSPGKRSRVHSMIGRKIQQRTRANVRNQRDIHGAPFKARKRKRRTNKRKMLSRLVRELTQRANAGQVIIKFRSDGTARIAAAHQQGLVERVTAKSQRQQTQSKRSASREQARVLVQELHYRVPVKGGGRRRVSQRWIMDNMSIARAGVLIRTLRDRELKTIWKTELPQRAFFGGEVRDIRQIIIDVADKEILRQLQL
uniref:Phage virion morphogenesis family protein n=1 Tax=Candidatus Kentrum sp. FM TaxID=2126340 RepID=A0A450RV28_9GAMM|nr:MAG: Phage virion morphogenesis family protein [Candidatus Kentron sp. FM]VFJ43646.1 MAG: Phage virion morphogenesis family protein [Candidatus Kentron sp. FM]VFK05650.1 MAG: Phage virion morphogenesis family protein [Candidatus Kentron sp. FM]